MECALNVGPWTWSLGAFSPSFSWTASFPVAGRGSWRSCCHPGAVWGVLPWYAPGQAAGLHQGGLARSLSCLLPGAWVIRCLRRLGLGSFIWLWTLGDFLGKECVPRFTSPDLGGSGSVTHFHIRTGSPWLRWCPLLRIAFSVSQNWSQNSSLLEPQLGAN